ncbi:hypothetical protein [Dyadobacter sp. CY312]|uniref:hypothetical protein n=1 Tax=Dyadobacter sp. CY312 TaxID=2907303 RepID=UPI001F1B8030|nr:hypothetical protein [Dyadobacter sp. CY312]MCE7041995.1 hypothetical protein [Dyadobacter sp. CY312]
MKILILNILALLILAGCNSENKDSSHSDSTTMQDPNGHDHGSHAAGDPRVAEVMAIHDSIMPQMGAIMDLKQKITANLKTTDSLLVVKSTDVLKKRKEEAFTLHIQLDKADKEMMNWMHQYKADTLEKLGDSEATAYIADQKLKIETVRNQMNKGIADARAFLDKNSAL